MSDSLLPKISILMPIYNVQDYVADAIKSILNQTYQDFELLLLDDCSTDKTSEIVSQFNDSRIRYHRNENNLGLSENLNVGIRLSKGEYLARMDGDDISLPTRLEKQVAILDKNPEIGICGASFRFFGTQNSTLIQPRNHEDIKIQMLFGCCVTLVVMRKKVFLQNNLWYSANAFPAEDYKMWADCLHVTKIVNTQEVLFLYRMHETQISTTRAILQHQKSNLVRMEILDWLFPNFSIEEKNFFCNNFVPGQIESEEDYECFKKYSELIIGKNNEIRNFDSKLLDLKFKNHIKLAYANYKFQLYFSNGFTLKNYRKFVYDRSFRLFNIYKNITYFIKSVFSYKN